MRVFEGQRYVCFYDDAAGRVFEDMEFRRCHFESSAISIGFDPRLRSTFRRIRLEQCEEVGCSMTQSSST